MKLEEWQRFNNSVKDANNLKDKHVIGVCGDCKHWNDEVSSSHFASRVSSQGPVLDDWGECKLHPELEIPKYYGCIHWENKNE